MGFFSKNKEDKLTKFFKERNITFNEHDDLIELSLNFNNNKYFLHPYLKIDGNDLLFLSYNTYYSGDNEQIIDILNSLYSLENEIDNL